MVLEFLLHFSLAFSSQFSAENIEEFYKGEWNKVKSINCLFFIPHREDNCLRLKVSVRFYSAHFCKFIFSYLLLQMIISVRNAGLGQLKES